MEGNGQKSGVKMLISFFFIFEVFIFMISIPYSSTQQITKSKIPTLPNYQHEQDVSLISESQNKLTTAIYKVLAQGKGNMFFSPYSISTLMAMMYIGSKQNTKFELEVALYFPKKIDKVQNAYSDLTKDFQKVNPDYELASSNKIYVSAAQPVLPKYISDMRKYFGAVVNNVDFMNNEKVRKDINLDVENETKHKIKDLLPQGSILPSTRMVLVNAIYFKGLWTQQFKKSYTRDSEFSINNKNKVTVPMMMQERKFKVANVPELDARMLILDYQGSRLTLSIILPNKKNSLSGMEQKFINFDYSAYENVPEQKITIRIPRFRLEQTIKLDDDLLKQMGVRDLFLEGIADLSGISAAKDIFVSSGIHKAFIEVNEEGSEAAAATAMVSRTHSFVPSNYFTADHPFMFYIRDKRSGQILFMGRVVNPLL